jgi:hypothetical protein
MYLNTNNQKMYGGANKKQGLPRTVGLGQYSSKIIQLKAGYCRCLSAFTLGSNTSIPATSTPHVY